MQPELLSNAHNESFTLVKFAMKPSATVTCDSHGTLLALATLGDVTQKRSFLFISFGQSKKGSRNITGVIPGIFTLNAAMYIRHNSKKSYDR